MLTVCRLCLAKDAKFKIFQSQVAVRIMTCTGLEVESNDGLPQLICDACRLRLEEFHYFRKRCHGADRRLRCAKRLASESNPNSQTNCLLEGDEEDAINLQDVAQCTPTACSESNAHWRQEAAKLIRTEIDAYKKELLLRCKQQVRAEIEQQVRTEVEEVLLAEARKQCRLNVLDGLFYEIESFFVRKRNAVICEQTYGGSEGFISDSESLTTTIEQQPGNNNSETDAADLSVIELPDDEPLSVPVQQTPLENIREPLARPAPVAMMMPVPMVEINMQNVQPSLMQDELRDANFLHKSTVPTAPSKMQSQQHREHFSCSSIRKPKTPSQKLEVCRKHRLRTKPRCYSYNSRDVDVECYRCKLRKPKNLNVSAAS